MLDYYKTKKESRILGFLGLFLAIGFSFGFWWVGIAAVEEGGMLAASFPLLIAVGVSILAMRGCWILMNGPRIFVLSVDAEKIECGCEGKERTVFLRDILEIYWNDLEGLTMTVVKRNGKRVHFPYIDSVLGHKDFEPFIHYLWEFHPHIPIVGEVLGKRYRRKSEDESKIIKVA